MKEIVNKIIRRIKKEINKRFSSSKIPDIEYKTNNISLRIAVVGLGNQGGKLCMCLMKMGYNVVAVCDLSQKRLNKIIKEYPNLEITKNIKDLEKYDVDICVLATLASGRFSLIKELNNIGIKKILAEKPICNNISDNIAIFNYVEKNNIQIEVYHPFLFSEDSERFKKKIEEIDKGPFVNAKLFFKPSGLGNIGSHVLSSFQYLTNIQVNKVVSCKLYDNNKVVRNKSSNDPNAKVVFNTTENSNFSLDCSSQYCFKTKFFIEYKNLFVHLYNNDKMVILYKNKNQNDLMLISKNSINNYSGRFRAIDNAITKLNNQKSHSFKYALNAVELIIAAHLSFSNNQSVPIPIKNNVKTTYNFS